MSMDRSLKSKNILVRHRNVLTRAERIEELKEMGRWTDDSSPLHLPKVAHRKVAVGKREKAVKKTEEGEGEQPAAEEKKT